MTTHRYQEVIGGRVYHIEAARVHADRWRAQIVRIPGMPTALMPFYGPTPDDAARQLRAGLLRAHQTPPSPMARRPRPGLRRAVTGACR